MTVRARVAALLFSASLGALVVACSAASSSSPEEERLSASAEALLGFPDHPCPPTCDPGSHCGTTCDTCAVRNLSPHRGCDPLPRYYECVPDVCAVPDAAVDPAP
jgi:hypothetical protein